MNTQPSTLLTETFNGQNIATSEATGELISFAELMNRFCNAETKPLGTVGEGHHLAELDLEKNMAQMVFFIPSVSYKGVDIEVRIWWEDERMSPLSAYTFEGEKDENTLLTKEDKMQVLHAYICNAHQFIKMV